MTETWSVAARRKGTVTVRDLDGAFWNERLAIGGDVADTFPYRAIIGYGAPKKGADYVAFGAFFPTTHLSKPLKPRSFLV